MLGEGDARRGAEAFFGTGARLHEFALGWVAWEAPPAEPADESGAPRPPATIGGTAVVVDRRSGAVVPRPLLHPEEVARLYTDEYG